MKILLLDIETAPHRVYAWGLWDQNIGLNQIEEVGYTMCWSAKWLGQKEIMFSSIHETTKRKMLKGIYDLLNEADVVVHFNGKKFDIPTLNKEFILQGWPPPSPATQVDLYSAAKSRFRFPSNKLSYICGELELGDKVEHKGMELWRECMAGNDKAWDTMKRYNKQDIRLLEGLYMKMKPWLPNHPNYAVFDDIGKCRCPNCGSTDVQKRGFYHTKTMRYQRYQCMGCGAWSRSRTDVRDKMQRKNILVGVT